MTPRFLTHDELHLWLCELSDFHLRAVIRLVSDYQAARRALELSGPEESLSRYVDSQRAQEAFTALRERLQVCLEIHELPFLPSRLDAFVLHLGKEGFSSPVF